MNPSHITECARTWVGTRYHHQGRLKKTQEHRGGCDCLGLLIGVAAELELKSLKGSIVDFDCVEYGHLPDCDALYRQLSIHLVEEDPREIQEGDVALFRIDGRAQHLGLVSRLEEEGAPLGVIHAYAPARAVVEHRFEDIWHNRLEALFRMAEFNGLSHDAFSDSLYRARHR